ncbi:MAG: metallophosphoesterase [Lachnospiraceae bacterium]|nr:metallophosphoesterase [Lachnospiraceae bacterium]
MRIIHCADLHLDSKLNANLEGEKRALRKAELNGSFTRMIDYAKEYGIEAIIIAGDLFDTANVSVTVRDMVRDSIVNNPDIEFFYLKGNHDVESFLSALEELPANLHLFTTEWKSYELRDGVVITGAELEASNSITLYDNLLLDVDKLNIVTLHGQEVGYTSRKRNTAENIDISRLTGKCIDYLALGHIHSYRLRSLDKRGMYCYCGCIEGRGFDECGDHGFVLLEIDEATKKIEPVFIPFAKRKIYELVMDVSGADGTMKAADMISDMLDGMGIAPTSLIKLVLIGNVDVSVELSTSMITERFSDKYFYVTTEDKTKTFVDYDEYKLESSLKGEFVRLIYDDDSLDEDMKSEIIRCGIRALSGEEQLV